MTVSRSTTTSERRGARLARDGGAPVRPAGRTWPRWPEPTAQTHALIQSVLSSGRWALTSPEGAPLFERRFAAAFAQYLDVGHCVPVDHGSSALVVALESLGLSHGDLVLVPALTWVASASAVLRAGLVPVLIDVAADTGCVDVATVDLDLEPRAIIAVHWAAAMADIPGLEAVAGPHGIPIIEDAAQAHGAQWQGRSAGTLGRLGCFSMQNGKVLTGGEGGAVVTNDDALAPRLEELRADSRRYASSGEAGGLDLVTSASVMGANFCMSEFNAAVLCAQLDELDAQHETRNRNYLMLADLLSTVPGVRLLRPRPAQNRMSIYEVPFIFDALPDGATTEWIGEALTAELGTRFYPPREPLHRSRFLQPWTKPSLGPLTDRFRALHRGRSYPHADRLAASTVLAHHSVLLGPQEDMTDIAEAMAKIAAYLGLR